MNGNEGQVIPMNVAMTPVEVLPAAPAAPAAAPVADVLPGTAGVAANALAQGSVALRVMDKLMNKQPVSQAEMVAALAGVGGTLPPTMAAMAPVMAAMAPMMVPVPIGAPMAAESQGLVPAQQRAVVRPAAGQPQPAAPAAKPRPPLDKVLNINGKRLYDALGKVIPGCGVSITLYPSPDGENTVYHVAVIIPPDEESGEGTEILAEAKASHDHLGDALAAAFEQAATLLTEGA